MNEVEEGDDHGVDAWSSDYTPTFIDEHRNTIVAERIERPTAPATSEHLPTQRVIQREQDSTHHQQFNNNLDTTYFLHYHFFRGSIVSERVTEGGSCYKN